MLLLDTQALVWSRLGNRSLGRRAAEHIEHALRTGDAAVSAMTFWEIALLRSKDRMELVDDVSVWRAELLDAGLVEIPLDGEIGIRANLLPNFHNDPADRIIVATALAGHQLMTSDRRILRWNGNLNTLDARE